MLNFEDSFEVKTTPEKSYNQVADLEDLVKLVPDLISHEKISDTEMKLTAKAGVSFIKGKFDLVLDVTESEANKMITLKGRGNGSGASVDFTLNFQFTGENDQTKVQWKAEMNIVGTAASMGARMMKSAAQKYITKLVSSYKKALEEDQVK